MLQTTRLHLRGFLKRDLADLTALVCDKMASAYAPYDTQWPVDDQSLQDVLDYFISDDAWYAVELTEQGKVIGFVVASRTEDETVRDLGYTLHTAYQNQGYAFEACSALMAYCVRALGITRFTAGTADCNGPSVKLLAKLGFTKTRSHEASFVNDAEGRPLVFAAGSYEWLPCESEEGSHGAPHS